MLDRVQKGFVVVTVLATCLPAWGQLPDIPQGNIRIHLNPIATGMAAPDYAISPPGDTSRLFVVEQNGLLRIINNGVLQPGAALDLGPRVQVAPVGTGPFNPGNANDERGFLGLAFHPGFNNPVSPGFRTLYTYTTEGVSAQPNPTYPLPVPTAPHNFNMVVAEWKTSLTNPNVVDPAS